MILKKAGAINYLKGLHIIGLIRFAVVLHRREFFILRLLLVRSLVYLAWARTACPASAA